MPVWCCRMIRSMVSVTWILSALLLVSVAPSASAHSCRMTNYGVILDATGSATFCGTCTNNGIMVLVLSDWSCGECVNYGLIVAVGPNCFNEHGGYLVNLCYDAVCYLDTN